MRRAIVWAVAAVISGSVWGASGAVAQTAPTQPTQPTGQGQAAPAAPAAGGMSSPYWNNTGSDLPSTDIRALPPARANLVKSRWTFYQRLDDLNTAVRLMRMRMDLQPEYVQALADEKNAYNTAEAARTKALLALQDNAAYSGAQKLRDNLSQQIADEREQPKPDQGKLAAMAKLKLEYVRENRKLEADALERDAAYQDARRKSLEASARVADFRRSQAYVFATDDMLGSLRRDLAYARIDKLTAAAYYDGLIVAKYDALDYADANRDAWRTRGVVGNAYDYGYGYGGFGYGGYGYTGFGYGGLGLGTVGGFGPVRLGAVAGPAVTTPAAGGSRIVGGGFGYGGVLR